METIGAVLPAALAVALSPFPVIGVVLLLAGRRGDRNGSLFAIGWVAGLTIVAALVVVAFSGADDPDSTSSAIADWLRVLAGVGMIAMGVRKWSKRPRADEDAEVPSWMASLDDATAGRALTLGLVLSAANPKNIALTASASTSIVEAGAHDAALAVALVAFVLLGSCIVLGAVVAHFTGGPRAAASLEDVRRFMIANSAVIVMIVLLLLGASILGDGIAGLNR